MTDFATDVLTFAARTTPGAIAGAAEMYGKNVSGVTGLHVQSSDGTEHQLTPTVASAGTVTYSQLANAFTFGGGNTLTNDTTAQNIFPANRDTITIVGNTTYRMRGQLVMQRAGAVNTATQLSFNAGTASYTYFTYVSRSVQCTTPAQTGLALYHNIATSEAATNNSLSSTLPYRMSYFDGIFVTNGGGTFIPRVTHTVAPGSVVSILLAWLELTPVGANTFTQQGGWT